MRWATRSKTKSIKRMRKIIFCLLILFSIHTQAQVKHALLIGIGDYDTRITNWAKLNSVKDIEVIRATLLRQNFEPGKITSIIDKDATKTNIVAAIKQLINSIKQSSGDVVYIHVSSHGAQLEDDNEDEIDGLDEAIVTINAKWTDDKNEFSKIAGEYLRDDEFGQLVEQLRTKLGKDGDVVVCMDLCHSGTATRGELVARGNKPALVSGKLKMTKKAGEDLKEFRENNLASRGDNTGLATYVVISAARAEEAAYETLNDENKKMGALSYAFSKSLENLKDSTTYRSLFASIEAIMDQKSNIQHPVLEGNGIDRGFLGGKFLVQQPYVEIESVNLENKIIKIKAGSFSGIDVGTAVAFYPSGIPDTINQKILAKGKVITATEFSADVIVDKLPFGEAKQVWGFVTEPVFRVKPIAIKIEDKKNSASFSVQEATAIKQKLKPLKQVVFNTTAPDLLLVKGQGHDSIFIANNGFLFGTTAKRTLEENLKIYSKYRYLKDLVVKDNSIDVDVKLGKLVNGKVEFQLPSNTVKGYEYNVGEIMIFGVHNKGAEDVYINILDFQPDGIVNPLLPNKSLNKPIQPFELKVPAGKEIIFKDYQVKIGPPLGSEVLKIFISDQEIDMEGVAKEFKARSFMSALESLVADAPKAITRGGDVLNLKQAKGVVYNIPFQIKAKK
jgi:metacaspase-1